MRTNASVIIATANRAADLHDTLENLARIHRPGTVELIVVDNCSTDDTRQVVDHAAAWYPFPVRYLFEQEEGKYAALNAGIKAARWRRHRRHRRRCAVRSRLAGAGG